MNEHRRRILDMLAAGKITADEAEKLLSALSDAEPPPAGVPPDTEGSGKYLRIEVSKPAHHGLREKNVKIRVPVSLLKSGMKFGALLQGFKDDHWGGWSKHVRASALGKDIDLSQFDAAQLDALLAHAGDVSIDVDNGKATIRVVRE